MIGKKTVAWLYKIVICSPLVWVFDVPAQDLRDPTVPPTQAAAALDAPAPSPLGVVGTSVIVRDGKAGLVQGTRIVFPGQKWGRWTLERITETEVWLRDGRTLQKMPRFSGIQRSDSAVRLAACAARGTAAAPVTANNRKNPKLSPTSTSADAPCDAPHTRSFNP